MLLSPLLFHITLFCGLLVSAQSPLQLGYIPLAVRTPYLHGWIVSNQGSSPSNAWPNFYTTNREFGWGGLIRVDGKAYQWMGRSGFNFTRTVTSEITPTKSIFRLEAGPIQFNVTFLSPIEPTDYVRQSIPFSYLYIDGIAANDTAPHTVQVYTDISGQWVTRDDQAVIVWDTSQRSNMVYHRVVRQNPSPMLDHGDIAEDSTGYYAMEERPNLTWQTGIDVDCRARFANNGSMANSSDSNFRAVSLNWPVFAISVDLGVISAGTQPDPVVWALGLVREPLLTYTTESAVNSRSAYYRSVYSTADQVISAFLSDFPDARSRSDAWDSKITSDASAVSPEYTTILSLVTRQIFASMDITLPTPKAGLADTTDVKIFMKDIGTSLRTNPVEVIYGAFPALLYFNPTMARHLLQPLFEFQSSNRYKNAFASPDLGVTYPVVLGNTSDTQVLGVEHCGNMLIMAYAHAVKSGDGSLISRYHSILQRWADFLVDNALHASNSITADGLDNQGMSNLAFKGILGVYSMAKINEAVGLSHDTSYMTQAMSLISDWKNLSLTDSHIQSVYGQKSSWGLMYNLFPAIWLNTSLIDDDLLALQAQWYGQQPSSDFGPGLDSTSSDVIYPHWTLLTAATIPAALSTIRNKLIQSVQQRAYLLKSQVPLPARYQAVDGVPVTGSGSPVHGAAFGILALGLENRQIKADPISQTTSSTPDPSGMKSNVGAIVGGVIGGLAFLIVVAALILFFWRRRRPQYEESGYNNYSAPHPFMASKEALTQPVTLNTNNAPLPQQTSQGGSVSYGTSPTQSEPNGQWRPDWEGLSQSRQPAEAESYGLPAGAALTITPLTTTTTLSSTAVNKQREAMALQRQSTSGMTSLSNPYSTSSGTEELRAEVEMLRREMNSIRAMQEPPPLYT